MRHLSRSVRAAVVLLLLAAATLLVAGPAAAATSGDFTYDVFGSNATITGYTGSDTVVTIPATIGDGGSTYIVDTIGDYVFNNRALTSVTIPTSVTTIGSNAFARNDLTSLTIPDSVITIGDEAFMMNYYLTSVTIPNSVTTIGHSAFTSNALTSLSIGDSVSTIGDAAFQGNGLTSVTIPDSVTTIGHFAFYSNALTSIVIPDSVTTLGVSAFHTNALTSVTIGSSVTTIGYDTFAYNDLTSVTIPATVTAIGNGAFRDNTSLTSVIFNGNAPALGVTSLGTAPGLIAYTYSGATGFSPLWNGYVTRMISVADSTLSITPTAAVIANGTASYTATVTVRDETGAPVNGVSVSFAVPAGVTASATGCTTAAGNCSITLTSTTAATYAVTATIGVDPTTLSRNVVFVAATTPAGGPGSTLPPTGLDVAAPLTLAGGLIAIGLALLTPVTLRRRSTLGLQDQESSTPGVSSKA